MSHNKYLLVQLLIIFPTKNTFQTVDIMIQMTMSYHFTHKVDTMSLNKVYMILTNIIMIILILTNQNNNFSDHKENKERKVVQDKNKIIKQES